MAKQPRSLTGQVAAVTGGARGIGRATAHAFLREGMRVAIGDLDLAAAESTAKELGGECVAFEVNVADRESFAAFLDAVEERLGPLDVLVNNAGIMHLGRFVDEDDATAQRQIDINLHGVLYGMKLALPRMQARNRGHLVNIASSAGKGGYPGGATYCATKHAVVGVTEAVRAEFRDTDIEFSCVMPGVVKTELAAGLKQGRGIKTVEPADVAAGIVEALRFPRFEVFVPKSLGPTFKLSGLLSQNGRERLARLFGADKVLAEADPRSRRAYEDRAAHSEPGLEPEAVQAVGEPAAKPEPEGAAVS